MATTSTAIIDRRPKHVLKAETLADLAVRIVAAQKETSDAANSALIHAWTVGELLHTAKKLVKHGQWLPWLREHCHLSERSAQSYMRLYEERGRIAERLSGDAWAASEAGEIDPRAPQTIRGALALLPSKPKAANPQRVADLVESPVVTMEAEVIRTTTKAKQAEPATIDRAQIFGEYENGIMTGVEAALAAIAARPEFENMVEDIILHVRGELWRSPSHHVERLVGDLRRFASATAAGTCVEDCHRKDHEGRCPYQAGA